MNLVLVPLVLSLRYGHMAQIGTVILVWPSDVGEMTSDLTDELARFKRNTSGNVSKNLAMVA